MNQQTREANKERYQSLLAQEPEVARWVRSKTLVFRVIAVLLAIHGILGVIAYVQMGTEVNLAVEIFKCLMGIFWLWVLISPQRTWRISTILYFSAFLNMWNVISTYFKNFVGEFWEFLMYYPLGGIMFLLETVTTILLLTTAIYLTIPKSSRKLSERAEELLKAFAASAGMQPNPPAEVEVQREGATEQVREATEDANGQGMAPLPKWFLSLGSALFVSVISVGLAMLVYLADNPLLGAGSQSKAKVPDPLVYDMTEQAKCSGIIDYFYNKKGKLTGEREYRYSDHAQPIFHLVSETKYQYDKNGEIVDRTQALMNQFGTPPVYEYEKPCEYTEDGTRVCQYVRQTDKHRRIWMDYYDAQGHLISTCYGLDDENISSQLSFAEVELLCRPGYYAHYDGDRLIDEISDQIDREDMYSTGTYCFYDYDDEGRQIWRYRVLIHADNRLYAVRSVYDKEGRKVREIKYTIYGDWKHTLYDGTAIGLRRDENERITDIIRYDENGGIMYAYQFCPEENSDRLRLTYSYDAQQGGVSALWQSPLLEYRMTYGRMGDFGAYH